MKLLKLDQECPSKNTKHKRLKKESLRDNMSNMELVLNMLAEVSTTEISKERDPIDLEQSKEVAQAGGNVAYQARQVLEQQTGENLLTKKNMEI